MKFKYLVISGGFIWGKHELTKEYFVAAVGRGDEIINTEDSTFFDKDDNEWKPIQGDKESE